MGTWCGGWPDYDAMLGQMWGAGEETRAVWCPWWAGASNVVVGTNPPYTLDDFYAMYPKFFGLATAVGGCATVGGSATLQVPSTNGLARGQYVQGAGLQGGTVIVNLVDATHVLLNQPAVMTQSNLSVSVFQTAPIPVSVIQLYLNLAYASLVQARWQDSWLIGMGWFIAHYLTLWAQSDATEVLTTLATATHGEQPAGVVPGSIFTLSVPPPGGAVQSLTYNGVFLTPAVDYALSGQTVTLTTPITRGALWATWPVQSAQLTPAVPTGASIAAQGLAGGIQTSKGVGDVSVSYQPLASLEQWGQWQLTKYGQQLATMASVIGGGPMWLY